MMPANRILIGTFGVRRSTFDVLRAAIDALAVSERRTTNDERRTTVSLSPFGCLDELIHALRLVERLADRQPRAHPAIQLARDEQLLVASLGGDLAAVEDEDAVGVAHGGQPVRDDDRGAPGPQPPQ